VDTINGVPGKRKRKNPAAVALGRRGGARSRINLAPEQRTALGRKAAAARWAKTKAEHGHTPEAADKGVRPAK
jgi:hypothetical protein